MTSEKPAIPLRTLGLFRKADQRQLSEKEKLEWLEILDDMNFQTFCIDRAQPHYMEGQIASKQPDHIRVEWYDGVRDNISLLACGLLMHLKVGDEFTAWVKLGNEERALCIELIQEGQQECVRDRSDLSLRPRKTRQSLPPHQIT
jgi:hypothetical protein